MSTLSIARDERLTPRVVHLPVPRSHRWPTLPVVSLVGWLVTALGVYSMGFLAHGPLRGITPAALTVARIVFIIAIGAAFASAVRGADPELVMATGLGWLVLSIVADFVAGTRSFDVVYRLLGDPTVVSQSLRNLTILAWLAAPALFARSAGGGDRTGRYQ
jgi:hypothetical protein